MILLCNTWRGSLAVKQCIGYLDVDKFTAGFCANSVKLLTLCIVSFEWNIWILRLFKKLNKNWQAWNNNKIFEIKIIIICVRSYHREELKKISIEVFIFQGNFSNFSPTQDGGQKTIPSHLFFRCNFYKGRNQTSKLSYF